MLKDICDNNISKEQLEKHKLSTNNTMNYLNNENNFSEIQLN